MKKILFLFAIAFHFATHAQSPPCISDGIRTNMIKENPQLGIAIENVDKAIRAQYAHSKTNLSLPPAGSILIPVVFYIVHDPAIPSTNVPDAQVQAQLTALNNKFNDTGMKFCLASKAGIGTQVPMNPTYTQTQTTPGIIHVASAALSNHYSSTTDLASIPHTSITADRYLRIWVVKSIDGPTSSTLGYAYFPGYSTFQDGIVIKSNVCGYLNANLLANYNQGETLVHEVGHYLGLHHTFHNGCISTGDCLYDGDKVCDTPATAVMNFYCTPINSCPETPAINDDVTNYMDYGNHVCTNHFTMGQKERMIHTLNAVRSSLFDNDNLVYTGGTCGNTNLVSSLFTADKYSVCHTAGTVNFTATAGQQFAWDFGDPSSPSNTSTVFNPSHTFSSIANSPYTVTLTVTANGNSTTSTAKIYVTDCSTFVPNSDSYWYAGISNGLKFTGGLPSFDNTFPQNRAWTRAATSVAKANGSLLFYTNGRDVWNESHVKINTAGELSQAQVSLSKDLIVPNPGNPNQYYILTSRDGSFVYSIVNIVGGIASTVPVIKQPVPAPPGYWAAANGAVLAGSGFTAIKKCNGDYWILVLINKNDQYYLVTYSLTSTGITFATDPNLPPLPYAGVDIEAAPNGNKICIYNNPNQTFLFDFDKTNGFINNKVIINGDASPANWYAKEVSFSPDSKLLYTIEDNSKANLVYQYNLNAADINSSKIQVGSDGNLLGNQSYGMQLGPDNKIYFDVKTKNYKGKLGVIHSPNILATSENPGLCQYTANGVSNGNLIQANFVGNSLPNLIDAKQETAYPTAAADKISIYTTGCNTFKFFANVCGRGLYWTFNNTTIGNVITSSDTSPELTLADGSYIITIKDIGDAALATKTLQVNAFTAPAISGNTTACLTENAITSNSAVLSAGQTALWTATGGTITGPNNTSSVNVNWTSLPGTLQLKVTNAAGCFATTTKTVTSLCPCDCLSTMYLKMTPQLGNTYRFNVMNTNTNIICSGLNLRYVWSFPNGSSTTNTTGVVYNTQQIATVVIELLSPTGTVICSVTRSYHTGGTGSSKTSIETVTNETPDVIVNPNPSQGLFNLLIEGYYGKLNIKVIDTNGREVFTENEEHFQTEKLLNLSHLSSGIYILKINGESVNSTQKIIKK